MGQAGGGKQKEWPKRKQPQPTLVPPEARWLILCNPGLIITD